MVKERRQNRLKDRSRIISSSEPRTGSSTMLPKERRHNRLKDCSESSLLRNIAMVPPPSFPRNVARTSRVTAQNLTFF